MEPVTDQRLYSGRYRVTHLIARGGMAQVYRAMDTLLNRPVALKVLYPELSVDPTFVERFRREAQAAANLSHPNIVPVFDWGEDGGTYFIVMELIEGASLAGLLREHRTLSPARAASLVAQVAAALAYAHRSGVVHRDVKPGNILLTNDGQVKVTDFGIAQAISTEDNLTVAGSVMGTATYFSPEQAEGANVDGRSDVYSLGVVLYELLAGRPPFVGDSPVAVAGMHVRDVAQSPRQYNPDLPTDLEAVVMLALSKRPGSRYQSADDFRADLLRFSEGQPVSAARGRAFAGNDATQAVRMVAGERTQAVPVMSGPRTDVVRRRRAASSRNYFAAAIVIALTIVTVGYFVTKAKTPSNMPNVIGMTATAATSQLRGDGLVIGGTDLVKSSKPAGTVVNTTPKPGDKITHGQSVRLQISLGANSQPVQIPDLTGMALSDAENLLQNAHLSYRVQFTSTAAAGSPNTVLSQYPVGGSTGQTGDKVILTVLSKDAQFPLTDLAGMTVVQAASTLGQAGLTVDATQGSACSNTQPVGVVTATNPAAGQPVSSGASIQLIVSNGPCEVVVPTVIGFSKTNATSAITGQGLVANYVTLSSTNALCVGKSGTVIDQDVPGGGQALYGSTINLTYCP